MPVDASFHTVAPATPSVLPVRQTRPRSAFARPAESRSAAARLSLLHLPLLYNSLATCLTSAVRIEWHHAGLSAPRSSWTLRQRLWLPLALVRIRQGDWATLARFELRLFHAMHLKHQIVLTGRWLLLLSPVANPSLH